MKVCCLLLSVFTFLFIDGQKQTNDSLAKIILQNNTFQKNHYDKKYLLIGSFSNGNKNLAKIKTENGWGFINKNGKEIIPAIFDDVQNYQYSIAGFYKQQNPNQKPLKCQKIFNFKGKEITNICQEEYRDVKKIGTLGRFLKITEDYNKTGIIDLEGKTIIPLKYNDITLFGDYLFCEDVYPKRATHIFDLKGKFHKTLPSVNIQTFMEKKHLVQVIDIYDKRYLLSLQTLEPVTEKYDWGQFDDYSDNPDLYVKHYDYYNRNESYILNKKFEVINKNYPESYPFLEKYLIHKTHPSGYTSDTVTVLNLKGKVLAKYLYDDYDRLSFFVPGKLDNPKYIEKNKERFLKYKNIQSINREENDSDAYRFFFELGDPIIEKYGSHSIAKSFNVIETQNGKILFTLPPDKIENFFYEDSDNPKFFIVYNNGLTKVYNRDGEILKTLEFKVRKEKFSTLPLLVIQNENPINILNKTYEKVFTDDTTTFSQTENQDIFIVGNGGIFGLVDIKGKIIKPFIYNSIISNAFNYSILEMKSNGAYEEFDLKTLKNKIKITTNGIGIYFYDGLIQFGNNAMIDLYGNYYQNYIEPKPREFYEE